MSTVEITEVPPSKLWAVVRCTARRDMPSAIRGGFDAIYARLGAAKARAGHNVIIYRSPTPETMELVIGVQMTGDDAPPDGLVVHEVPSGRAAHYVHLGSYGELGTAHDAVGALAAAHGHGPGIHWEVYGDWDEDPSKVRTDVYRSLGA